MGGELLEGKGAHERDDGGQPEDDQDVRGDGGESKTASGEDCEGAGGEITNLVGVLSTTVGHYFPKFNDWLKGLTDIRDQGAIIYERQTLVWAGLLALVSKRGARMSITHDMRTENFGRNLKELCGQEDLGSVPHGDTVEYLATRLKAGELEELPGKMVRALLRGRVLEGHRLFKKHHTIAIDAVHVHTFDYPHCEHCLHGEDKATGQKWWMHVKLQASLVTPTGLCLPVACEWIENEAHYVKQDCELRACHRLLVKLRELFPLLPICVLLDGLYANQPMFNALKKAKMEWIVVFKEGSMSYIHPWVMSIKRICGKNNVIVEKQEELIEERCRRDHQQRLARGKPKRKTRLRVRETTYTWKKGIEFSEERSLFNIVTCHETVDGKKVCDYVWLVSDGLNLDESTVKQLATRGRCRWKIENEGFNTQKNGGYRLEHLYSRDMVSMKVWCALIDIAHLISQLIEKGSLIAVKSFGTIRAIAETIFDHFQKYIYKKPADPPRIQIRLSWNTS
jgi:hypothetical protein